MPTIVSEAIGWLATAFLFLSVSQKDLGLLRVFGLLGCLCWIIYAIPLGSAQLLVTNGALMVLHLYRLWEARRESAPPQEAVAGEA